MKKSWVGEGPAPSGCLIRLMLCTKCAKAAVCPWQFRCAPSHAVCIQLGTDTWPGDGLALDFHSSPWGRMQRKISRCTCAQTHAHAVERTVPTTLIIIKHQTSFLSYRNFKLMFICLVLIFTVSWKTTDTDTDRNNSLKAFSCSNPAAACQLSEKKGVWEIMSQGFVFSKDKSQSLQGKDWLQPIRESQEVLWEALVRIQDSPPVFERQKNNKGKEDYNKIRTLHAN